MRCEVAIRQAGGWGLRGSKERSSAAAAVRRPPTPLDSWTGRATPCSVLHRSTDEEHMYNIPGDPTATLSLPVAAHVRGNPAG